LPLTQEPDLQYLMNVTEQLAQDILDDSLIILRSTVPIGTTRSIVLPILQRRCADVKIAFCPERTVEGHALAELTSLPQIIGGLEQESIDRAAQIFEKITPHIVRVSSLETAEMVKLLDNSFRDLNFAYANQVAEIAPRFGVDAMEAITCANQGYTRNRIPVPGFVGGACLEKDPHILTYCTKNRGYDSSLIRIGRAIHERLPVTVVARVRQLLQDFGKPPQTAKIFLTGLAFKGEPETDDLRGSPSRIIVKALHEAGFSAVYVHDFVVPYDSLKTWDVIPVTIEEGFKSADAIIIANNHARYKSLPIRELLSTSNLPVILYDSWRIFSKDDLDVPGIHYEGLGFQKL
ncbi:MAG TPA: nucleotide sugar dehydrogenase, partial [Bacillota bacterium]|nr:nucleotide sugar dehydrogenase [Bacillota bacterium]